MINILFKILKKIIILIILILKIIIISSSKINLTNILILNLIKFSKIIYKVMEIIFLIFDKKYIFIKILIF